METRIMYVGDDDFAQMLRTSYHSRYWIWPTSQLLAEMTFVADNGDLDAVAAIQRVLKCRKVQSPSKA